MEDEGMSLNHGETVLESDCVEIGTWFAVWLCSSSVAYLRHMQLRVRSKLS